MERASRGEVTIPPEAVLDFANDCKDSVTVQLNKEKSYKLRMSGLGRPVCQQLLEKNGIEQEVQYNLLYIKIIILVLLMEYNILNVLLYLKKVNSGLTSI